MIELYQVDKSNVLAWFDELMDSKSKGLNAYYKNPKITQKFIQSAKQVIRSGNILQTLLTITDEKDRNHFVKTLFEAIDNVASCNLSLGSTAQHVDIHVIDEKGRKTVYCSLMYQGILEICFRNPKLKAVGAAVIRKREGEIFEWFGIDTKPNHKIGIDALSQPGYIVGAWAFAELENGAKVYELCDKAELDHIKSCCKSTNFVNNWYEEWAKKVVLRRLTKKLPKTRELQDFEQIDNKDYELDTVRTNTTAKLADIAKEGK